MHSTVKNIPTKLWDEAINCSIYIQNRVRHKHLKWVTLFEACTSEKTIVKHFSVFGSRALARIPSKKRRALEDQSDECLFVGYPESIKGYRILNIHTEICFVEISLKFDEML